MPKELDKSVGHYRWVLQTWLTTPGLTSAEITTIEAFQRALNNSLAEFDALRQLAIQNGHFQAVVQSAAIKAVAHGHLINWSEYAEAT